jgi:hypothetical protein
MRNSTAWLSVLEERPVRHFERSPVTGLPVIHAGRVITSEDVKALEDDE